MIRVMIVDDSAIVRAVLKKELSKAIDIEIVASVPDPYVARNQIAKIKPHVIILDIEMPRMDGLTFLEKLMEHFPIPVIMVSSLGKKNSVTALKALQLGAFEVIAKPGEAYSIDEVIPKLIETIRVASRYVAKKIIPAKIGKKTAIKSLERTTNKIIAIGSSTGGTRALEDILPTLPATSPGILVVQHMPAGFTKSFADRLNGLCEVEVTEAKKGDSVIPGKVLIAPGNYHMVLKRDGARYIVDIISGSQVFHQRPSVEVMFNSVAKYCGKNSVGVMLTGMGADGASGLLNIKNSGAKTIAQDEKTSIVWGMPGKAVSIGAVDFILPLNRILPKALDLCR